MHEVPVEPKAQSTITEFKRQDPPCFSEELDPIEAKLLLKRISLAFEMIELKEDVLRIRAAMYQFLGRVLTWWDVVKTTHNLATMTWAEFECLFRQLFFASGAQCQDTRGLNSREI